METISKSGLDELLLAMLKSEEGISDLLFVVGKPPQVEAYGLLKPFLAQPVLTGARIESLANVIINDNPRLAKDLEQHGSCDCSFPLADICRFRTNIYRQNGSLAMVMRRLSPQIPSMESLQLPAAFREALKEKTGLVFITGSTGSGKTTTLAALLNEINQTSEVHIVTLEDPVEFLHPHLKATFSQRELGRDFFNFPEGLRAALRQAPKIIFVGEIRDRETMEIALTAGETGHLVFSTLHTNNAAQSINRILGLFNRDEEAQVRERLVGSLRYIISQRLVPKVGGGRFLVTEMMGSSLRTREVISLGENDNRRLAEIIESGNVSGWHSFEQSLLKAFEADLVTEETVMLYCTNKVSMHQRLDMVNRRRETARIANTLKMRGDEPARNAKPAPPPMLDEPPKPV